MLQRNVVLEKKRRKTEMNLHKFYFFMVDFSLLRVFFGYLILCIVYLCTSVGNGKDNAHLADIRAWLVLARCIYMCVRLGVFDVCSVCHGNRLGTRNVLHINRKIRLVFLCCDMECETNAPKIKLNRTHRWDVKMLSCEERRKWFRRQWTLFFLVEKFSLFPRFDYK